MKQEGGAGAEARGMAELDVVEDLLKELKGEFKEWWQSSYAGNHWRQC